MRSKYFIGFCVLLFHVFASATAANILSLIEVLEPDQQIWYDALFKGLIGRGHTLTVVSGNARPTKSSHITQIHLDEIAKTLRQNNSPKLFSNTWLSPFEQLFYWYDRQMKICQSVLSSDGLQELIELAPSQSEEQQPYDLILYDATYGPSCLLLLTELFKNVPIVGVSASQITPDLLSVARGSQVQPATVPHFLTAHSENMNFFVRLHNTIIYAMGDFFRKYVVTSVQEAMLAKSEWLKEAQIKPKLENIIERIKVVLVNSHPSIDYVHSLPPNVVEVGGLQFDNFNRAVSVDIQTFIDNSKGVFVITISDVESPHVIETVTQTVDKFPEYGFIWGAEKGSLPAVGSRANLFVGKWLKRSVVLAQHKVRALITTGSHMEIQEAVYHGVPVIAISHGLDNIAQHAQDLGFGIKVDLRVDPGMLTNAIQVLTSDGNFSEIAKSRQLAFRIRPQHPLDTALWWIEHVIANPIETGYIFSQAVAETSFFVLHSLDVMAVFAFTFAMFLINSYIVFKQLKESCKPKKQTENSVKTISSNRKPKKAERNKKKSE
ncbi:UDP-glycosyltransferase UGT5 [Eurosta solidaginis]|uniref:UDP-glycosyltransferase UGT5 n=1 Tax=Eurosta solidaginis TaxID=178769 RepID=UPI003530A46B